MNDYSEVTVGLNKKINSLNFVLNEKNVNAAISILKDINADLTKLNLFLKERLEEKRE